MDSNTHSICHPAGSPDGLASLTAAVQELAAQELDRLTDAALAEQVLGLRGLVDRLEGHWLQQLAALDSRGAAGAELGQQVGSTAAWLRTRLRLGASTAASLVRTARALFGGPLAATAEALVGGDISVAHARVLAHGTQELPERVTVEAEAVLVAAACRLDPPRLRRVLGHLVVLADPEAADRHTQLRHARRGLWLAPSLEGMVAVDGLLEPEAGQNLVAALEPLARPADASDARSGSQRRADALAELARRALEGGRLPQTGGVRPQLTVTVDLDSLLGGSGSLGGELGRMGPLAPEGCRRLAGDGALTRVLVTRHPDHQQHPSHHRHPDHHNDPDHHDGPHGHGDGPYGHGDEALAERLRAAVALLPPALGGAPTQPLEVGRTTRVVGAAQRTALAVRDGGCVFPGCSRPLAWCEAHHLRHWLHGGPTDLANLALLCRAHHRAVHEGGWRLQGHPDGQLTAVPSHRPHRPQRRRHPTAA